MHHTTIFAIAAYAALAVANPVAHPAPEAEANPQLPGPPGIPNLPLLNLPGLPNLPGLAPSAPSGAGAGNNQPSGLPLPPLPVVGNPPLPPLPNLPIPPLPNVPGPGSLPLPLPGAGAGAGGLPNPQDLLGNVTSAIQVLQLVQSVLRGAVPGLPVGVGLGSGNTVVQALLGLVGPLIGGAGLPINV
ncbi:MAG: hypothetical protein Q9173_006961 [Seirophora scorigena]